MPLFYFDIRDGDLVARDTVGMEFATLQEAIREAKISLHEMALDDPAVSHSEVSMDVRMGERVLTTVTVITTAVSFLSPDAE